MMELFTLGADRGAYTETDVRENARALTGWRGGVNKGVITPFTYDLGQHDAGAKTIFGQSGNYDWHDSCNLCLNHPLHPSFFVSKLWGYFVPIRYDAATLDGLKSLYATRQIQPVVESILKHPAVYTGPKMAKPPVVFNAGLLRMRGRGIDTSAWWTLGQSAGQQLFYPPDVGGWDYSRWLDTATFRARWFIAALVMGPTSPPDSPNDPAQIVHRSVAYWGTPTLSTQTQNLLLGFAKAQLKRGAAPSDVETAVRRLVATSPDLQTA
jgi:uncharacterized protein (DUF1800 family)